ncbi:RluA family pseudouridine synthase [Hutsoniella sourekii]|uniref:RluA family pseudouridine synthase n=1 Tax=Hutsoniella sourekii TaxID=87650 RepID=UPI00047F84C2|nr:RluA family pseudouridine synthase [Hutsoniella sourekii]
MEIIYEDNHLLLVNKPRNMPVQEDNSRDLDLLTALKDMIKIRDQKPGNVYLALVHRLDRPVGGLMVFAKTSKAASRLSKVLRQKQMKRTYLAVVNGQPNSDQGQLVDYLWKDRQKNIVHVVDPSHPGAKKAILNYRVIDKIADHSLVQVSLETGRSHQIRVQLQHMGHPIYGDQKYGLDHSKVGQQLALWSYQLAFPHPTRQEIVNFQCMPVQEEPWTWFSQLK